MKHTSQAGVSCMSCEDKLKEVTPYLVAWYRKVKAVYLDVHVSWGFRDQASQQLAFTSGKSKLPWPRSKHNQQPSLAVDLFQIDEHGNAIFDPILMAKIAQAFSVGVRWGGNFPVLRDNDHFEVDEANPPDSAA